MGDFDVIECDFSNEDETINFGTRCLNDPTNLYEITTLACLKPSEGNVKTSERAVDVQGQICRGQVFFCVNKSLRVFEDKSCKDIVYNVAFHHPIKSFCVCPNQRFILICLNNGLVLVLDYMSSEKNCIFSQILETAAQNDEEVIVDNMIEICVEDRTHFLIITNNGALYRIIVVNRGETIEAEISKIHSFDIKVTQAAFSFPYLLINGSKMCVLNLITDIQMTADPLKLAKIFPIGLNFLALDESGRLVRICNLTLLHLILHQDTLYKNISVVTDGQKSDLITITQPNELGVSHIQLISGERFECIFSLKVSNEPVLLQNDSLIDETVFMSKVYENNALQEIRFCTIYETEPEKRLERLLRKQKFKEAEQFAVTFNIDPIVINKAKVQMIVDNMVCSTADIDQVIQLMDKIDDIGFKLQACYNMADSCSCESDVRRILFYGSSLSIHNNENKYVLLVTQQSLMSLLSKFETFMLLQKDFDLQSWKSFTSCDLIEEVKRMLRNHYIEEAIIIFSRLDSNLLSNLSNVVIEEILSVLSNLTLEIYQPFLPTFIPMTLNYHAASLPIFIKWLLSRIYQLEKRSNFDFPDNAIRFAETIMKLFTAKNNTSIMFQNQCMLNVEYLENLSELLTSLKGLQTLKNNFHIAIPLNEYLLGPKYIIRSTLNLSMNPEDYEHFLQNYLCGFMVKNQLDHNEILLEELKNLMNYEDKYWVDLVGPIVKCISCTESKLVAVQLLLDNASVPWNDKIRQIGLSVLKYSHPMVATVRELMEDEPAQVVLRKPKYKFRETRLSSCQLDHVIKRINYVNEPTVISDAFKLCKNKYDRRIANTILFTGYVKKGLNEEALKVLDNKDNTPEDIVTFIEDFIMSIDIAINEKFEYSDKYYSILNPLQKRYKKINPNGPVIFWSETDFQTIQNTYNIYKNFGVNVTTFGLKQQCRRQEIYDQLIEEIYLRFYSNNNIIKALKHCEEISKYLHVKTDEVVLRFCRKVCDFDLILQAAKYLYENETSAANLCLAAVLLLKTMGFVKEPSFDESFNFDGVRNIVNENNESMELISQICRRAVSIADHQDFYACLEVKVWIDSICSSDSSACLLPGYELDAVRHIFDVYCRSVAQHRNEATKYLTYFIEPTDFITDASLLDEIRILPNTIDNLCKKGKHLVAYRLIVRLSSILIFMKNMDSNTKLLIHKVITKKCIPILLNYLASKATLDKTLFIELLQNCNKEDVVQLVIQFLRMYKWKPTKLADISIAAIQLWDYHKITSVSKDAMETSILVAKWWNKINCCQIQYDTFFKVRANARLDLMIKFNYVNVELIDQYCVDFQLSPITYYKLFLMRTLTDFRPEFVINTDISGERQLLLNGDEKVLIAKCKGIMERIGNDGDILSTLNEAWSNANFYYYEVFISILRLRALITQSDFDKELPVLLYLKRYQRASKPSQTEVEEWSSRYPDKHTLDALAEFRLPFTPSLFTADIWSIIRPEINLKTYKSWLDAIDLLRDNLNRDDLCALAVKQVVSSGILGKPEESDAWSLHSKHDDLLEEIDECLRHISNLEVCTSVIYHVMVQMPKGVDQVNAAALCYKYARKYKEKFINDADVEKAFVKVERKYYCYSAMNILYAFQLNDAKYLDLVNVPTELITALYLDERILKRACSVDLYCPDINKAVDALALLFNLDVQIIRYNLLITWLSNSCATNTLNTSALFMSCSSTLTTNSFNADDNLQRVVYISTSGELSFWKDCLLGVGLDESDTEPKSNACKARALKCFCTISDKETVEKMTELEFDEVLNFIDKLSLLSDLEQLGMQMDVSALDKYNKKDLLKQLARQRTTSNVMTMASVCMTYNILDFKCWDYIISSAIALNMVDALQKFLAFLKDYPYRAVYISAWQVIVDNSCTMKVNASKEENLQIITDFCLMVQACPVLYHLKFEKIIDQCLQFNNVLFAAVLIQYLQVEKREAFAKIILKKTPTICDELDVISEHGIWGISIVKSYLTDISRR